MEAQGKRILSKSFLQGLAVVGLAFFLVVLAPLVGGIVLVLIPLPVILYYTKLGRTEGSVLVGTALILALIAASALGLPQSLPALFLLSAAGVATAEILKKNYSIEKTIWMTVSIIFGLGVLFVFVQSAFRGESPLHLLQGFVEHKIRASLEFYAAMNVSSDKLDLVKDNIVSISFFIAAISPAIAAVSLAFTVWVNLLISKSVFQKKALPFPDFGDLSCWKPPEKMVWYLIAAGAMLLLPNEKAAFIGWNMLIVIMFVYLLAGLAIVSFFLKKSALPVGFRFLIYFLIFAQQIITLLVIVAGLFDLWVDFRKLNKTMEDPVA